MAPPRSNIQHPERAALIQVQEHQSLNDHHLNHHPEPSKYENFSHSERNPPGTFPARNAMKESAALLLVDHNVGRLSQDSSHLSRQKSQIAVQEGAGEGLAAEADPQTQMVGQKDLRGNSKNC